jgi:hypothetical protein
VNFFSARNGSPGAGNTLSRRVLSDGLRIPLPVSVKQAETSERACKVEHRENAGDSAGRKSPAPTGQAIDFTQYYGAKKISEWNRLPDAASAGVWR